MNSFLQIPEWLATAMVGAVLAALGYVAKLFIELLQSKMDNRRLKRSRLIELQSLLKAAKVAFRIQNKHASKLTGRVETRYPEISQKYTGYAEKISRTFHSFDEEEKQIHSIIRSITINTLFTLNKEILEWLKTDMFFKARKSNNQTFSKLASILVVLESHLLLWIAKYEAWIPDHPEHALVYMADENEHGLGFPNEVDDLVDEAVDKF